MDFLKNRTDAIIYGGKKKLLVDLLPFCIIP